MDRKTWLPDIGWCIVEDDDEDEDEEESVDCCKACGNDAYPHCMDSCPLFDD